jgi:polar amino acid transport system substrate-binding protein
MRTLVCFLVVLSAACDLPRDQAGTWKRIGETKVIRIGLIESPPWVVRTGGEPAGAEVEGLRGFAASIGATPEWTWGGEEKLMGELEHFERDIVAGGITDKTPWSKRVGITDSYMDRHVLAVPPGENHLIAQLDRYFEANRASIESAIYNGGMR